MRTEPSGLGERAAEEYVTRRPRPSAQEVAKELGVVVIERESPAPAQPEVRAEYRADPPQIILYRTPLRRLAAALQASPEAKRLACDLDEVHLAHELFHHLESDGRFGRLRREESEGAAHAFARAFCGLSFDPRELSEVR